MGAGLLSPSDENIKTRAAGRRAASPGAEEDAGRHLPEYKPDAPAGDGGAVPHIGPMARTSRKRPGPATARPSVRRARHRTRRDQGARRQGRQDRRGAPAARRAASLEKRAA